jgi:hypothetical protein
MPTTGHGAVAQLGERVVRNDEVSGSIPLSSTSVFQHESYSAPVSGTILKDGAVSFVRPHPGKGEAMLVINPINDIWYKI